jgi:hypothetical protein
VIKDSFNQNRSTAPMPSSSSPPHPPPSSSSEAPSTANIVNNKKKTDTTTTTNKSFTEEATDEQSTDDGTAKEQKTKDKKVRFNESVDMRYIEAKEEMPNAEQYWLTSMDLDMIRRDVQKALQQNCPTVQKYQPSEVQKIFRKFQNRTRTVLRQQERNKKQLEGLLQRQQRQNNQFWNFFHKNRNRAASSRNDKEEEISVLIDGGATKIADLYRYAAEPDVENAIRVASDLEKELHEYNEDDFYQSPPISSSR